MTQLEKLAHAIELRRHLDALQLIWEVRRGKLTAVSVRQLIEARRNHTADMAYQLYTIFTKMWGDDWDVVHNKYVVHLYSQIEITTTTRLKHTSHEVFFALSIDNLIAGAVVPTFAKTAFTIDEVPYWYIHSHISVYSTPVNFRASACFGNIFRHSDLGFYEKIEAIIAILPQYLAIESVGTHPYYYVHEMTANRRNFWFASLRCPITPLTIRYSVNGNGVIEASVQDDAALDSWLAKEPYVNRLYQSGDSLYYKERDNLPHIPRNWHVPYLGKLYRVRILDEYQLTIIPPLIKQLTINELNKRITLELATKQRQEIYSGTNTESLNADTNSVLTAIG